jgi:hypothetical protein
MLTEADIASVVVDLVTLDGEKVTISSLCRCFAPVREEISVEILQFPNDEAERNRTLTIPFMRDGELYELTAFVILGEVEYTIGAGKVIRFSSLGGYTIAPAELKDQN